MSRLSPDEIREIRRLHLVAGRPVAAWMAGDHRSALRGQGMEFDEVRAYQPGDDVRHLDWNVTARAGEPYVKVFREERQNTVILALDVSGSSRVGSGGRDGVTTRGRQQARLVGALAWATLRARDRVGLYTFSDDVEQWLAPRRSRSHTWTILEQAFHPTAARRRTDLSRSLTTLRGRLTRRCSIILVTDALDAGSWERPLRALAAQHTVHALLTTDPLDLAAPNLGLLRVVDAETGHARLIDTASLTGRLTAQARADRLLRAGARVTVVDTSDDAFAALARTFGAKRGRRA
jgi:uncharacterized protein (DUF58 family)